MQQQLFPKQAGNDNKIQLGSRLELEIIKGIKPKARLYRAGIFIKPVELSDKIAKRLLVVEAVELGANQTKLAKALGISRQTSNFSIIPCILKKTLDSHSGWWYTLPHHGNFIHYSRQTAHS